jgi:hypothetical protein
MGTGAGQRSSSCSNSAAVASVTSLYALSDDSSIDDDEGSAIFLLGRDLRASSANLFVKALSYRNPWSISP